MSDLTHLFSKGQKVRCKMDGSFHKGIIKEIYQGHVIVNVSGISDHCWFEEGFNLDDLFPEYNFNQEAT